MRAGSGSGSDRARERRLNNRSGPDGDGDGDAATFHGAHALGMCSAVFVTDASDCIRQVGPACERGERDKERERRTGELSSDGRTCPQSAVRSPHLIPMPMHPLASARPSQASLAAAERAASIGAATCEREAATVSLVACRASRADANPSAVGSRQSNQPAAGANQPEQACSLSLDANRANRLSQAANSRPALPVCRSKRREQDRRLPTAI